MGELLFQFLILISSRLQKQSSTTKYVSSDKAVVEALQRNGSETKAPKNSYGCKHCAMSNMRKVSVSDFNHYIKKDEALYNQKCSGKNCIHDVTGKHWPVKKLCGEQWQAYWCKFGCTKQCTTYFCVDCGEKRLQKEESRSTSKRIRRKRG